MSALPWLLKGIQSGYSLLSLTMATYNRRGEFEPESVYIQVKATDRLTTLSGGERISWPLSRRDLKLWLAETYPVILIVYDGEKDQAYWLHVQPYILAGGMRELFRDWKLIPSIMSPFRHD
jgi:hypothetical protein